MPNLNDLKKSDKAAEAAPEKKEKKAKKKRERKYTDEELAELRRGNLKPKEKDPKKAAEEERIKKIISEALGSSKEGLPASKLAQMAFPDLNAEDKPSVKKAEKQIRYIARGMGCESNPMSDGSRRVLYTLGK